MTIIKNYRHVRPNDSGISFDIKRMEAIYEQMQGKSDHPHRHDYYTILLVKDAKGLHTIDFHEFELSPLQVFFISPGQVHQLKETEKPYGYVITFSTQFMLENSIEHCFIEDVHLFQDFGFTPPLTLSTAAFDLLEQLAIQMFDFIQTHKKFNYQAVGALLKLLLIHCNNFSTGQNEQNTQVLQASAVLLRSFKALLNQHFKEWHKVSDYATALHVTPDYLNTAVKSLTGKSAKEHIQSRIVIAAKRLLRFSELNTKSIAYELGFSVPANFSQFFKKCTGISPSKFKL